MCRRHLTGCLLAALAVSMVVAGEAWTFRNDLTQVQRIIRQQVTRLPFSPGMTASNDVILAPHLTSLFYKRRQFQPAWILTNGLSPEIQNLVEAIRTAEAEGLAPTDYHLGEMIYLTQSVREKIKKKPLEPGVAADFDLLCTDSFLTYATHLTHGKVDPETLEAVWPGTCIDETLIGLLDEALATGRVREILQSFVPQQPFYADLKKALSTYRELAGRVKWQPLAADPPLKRGDHGKAVKKLRERLLLLGDLDSGKRKPKDVFDEALDEAVRSFQTRHGLEATAGVDQPTLAALNRPPFELAKQIAINLERWRWLPRDLGRRFIYVNIANFELEVYESGTKVMSMKVVAGAEGWQTPDFSSRMTHLVVNPYWTIPVPVLLKEIVNYIQQDPCYLRNNKMVLLRRDGESETEIDPASVDWPKLTEKNLKFRVRQDPGPLNVLGRLKFVFPNKYEIFLHDTPYQEDFAKTARALSHGCIRAERPVELAAYVLRGWPGWDEARILAAIDANAERIIKLAEPIDICFLYCTAWPDDHGVMQFRPDIYERDEKLVQALGQKPPASGRY